MITPFINNTNLAVLENVMSFTQARHQVLAGNIANQDTPGYRVRDLSVETFQERLSEAIKAANHEQRPVTPGVVTRDYDEAMREVKDSMKSILYHDDSNISLEQQVTEMSKNQMMHNMAVSIITSQFRLLETVISEQL